MFLNEPKERIFCIREDGLRDLLVDWADVLGYSTIQGRKRKHLIDNLLNMEEIATTKLTGESSMGAKAVLPLTSSNRFCFTCQLASMFLYGRTSNLK